MHGLGAIELIAIPVGLLVGFFLFGVPFWQISKKAGYPPWLGLFIFVPGANIALLLFLAFSEWPIEHELRSLRAATPLPR